MFRTFRPLRIVPLLIAAVAVMVARTTDPDRPWLGAATMTGAAILVATPTYAWYALLLVVLVGLGARTVWLGVVAAGYLANFSGLLHVDGLIAQRVGYGLALWQQSIWYKIAWGTTIKSTIDSLIYGLLTAGVFGWLWPE